MLDFWLWDLPNGCVDIKNERMKHLTSMLGPKGSQPSGNASNETSSLFKVQKVCFFEFNKNKDTVGWGGVVTGYFTSPLRGAFPPPLEIFLPPLDEVKGGGIGPTLKILSYFLFSYVNFFHTCKI